MTKARTNADNVAGDISGVTAGTGLTGGGTSGTVTLTNDMATTINAAGDLIYGTGNDAYTRLALGTARQTLLTNAGATAPEWAASPQSLMTATGDILYASAANTPARLGLGTASQYLAVNSGATAPEWVTLNAGGMTLISTTTLSGASITLSSIPSTYNHLQLVIRNYIPATDGRALYMRYNSDSNTRYFFTSMNAATGSVETFAQNFLQIALGNDNAVSQSLTVVNIYDYTNTTTWKLSDNVSIVNDATTTTSVRCYAGAQAYNQTSAISSITLLPDVGNLTSGTVLLYGVK